MIKLGLNIDHVATLRQARGARYPNLVRAALICEEAGADAITIHLRVEPAHECCQYSEAGGSIAVTASRDGDGVAVTVRDTGIGIDAANLTRVFEMFGQIDAAIDRSQGGLGIGILAGTGAGDATRRPHHRAERRSGGMSFHGILSDLS